MSTHPASTTISAEKVPKDSPTLSLSGSKSNNDLLGINFGSADSGLLDNNNQSNLKGNTGSASDGDLFAAFGESGKSNQAKSAKDEEADFFNQKAPDMSKKLDMNSILKLYDSNPSTGTLFGAPAMNPQQAQLNQQQLPYGLQTLQTNPIQQPFGTFPQGSSAPGLIQQPLMPGGGLLPTGTPSGQSLPPPFGAPVATVTNPFLSTAPSMPAASMPAASIPAPSMSGFSMSQPSSAGVHQVRTNERKVRDRN